MDKVIVMLMKANIHRLSVQMIVNQKTSWKKELTFKCETCEYITKEEQNLVKHANKLHSQ